MIYIISRDYRHRAEIDVEFEGLYGGDVRLTSRCAFADAVLSTVAILKIPVDVCSSGHWTCSLIVRDWRSLDLNTNVMTLTPVKIK